MSLFRKILNIILCISCCFSLLCSGPWLPVSRGSRSLKKDTDSRVCGRQADTEWKSLPWSGYHHRGMAAWRNWQAPVAKYISVYQQRVRLPERQCRQSDRLCGQAHELAWLEKPTGTIQVVEWGKWSTYHPVCSSAKHCCFEDSCAPNSI